MKHYNKILKEQVGELDHEILHVENGFKHSYGIPPFIEVSPGTIMRNLADIFSLQESLHTLEHDLLVFDDIKQLKDWLKMVKRSLATPRFDDMPFWRSAVRHASSEVCRKHRVRLSEVNLCGRGAASLQVGREFCQKDEERLR
ncbi:hypothetical protein OI25_3002 [Paraburkholderia fungorum]|uniref:Uncharacterized protein n=1 Tax=Paraburkholderia fungorum TaxID=134537 RepID=A0AAU8SUK7_9BURK|nr:hypothetical protein [Paraburkholderia fungorum]AJZ57330.1 hypothetical protein OI25_3002 [Paraburkholderia fungorum]